MWVRAGVVLDAEPGRGVPNCGVRTSPIQTGHRGPRMTHNEQLTTNNEALA
jgi:hypothetical protein